MILKNWYKALMSQALYQAVTFVNYAGANISKSIGTSGYFNLFGFEYSNDYYPALKNIITTASMYSKAGVVFGTGTKEPTFDDYWLSGDQITTIECSVAVTRTMGDDGAIITGIYTITNTASSDITIGEVGLIASTAGTSTAGDRIMVERSVLDTPVTIPPGGIGQVTYTIRMGYPAA